MDDAVFDRRYDRPRRRIWDDPAQLPLPRMRQHTEHELGQVGDRVLGQVPLRQKRVALRKPPAISATAYAAIKRWC